MNDNEVATLFLNALSHKYFQMKDSCLIVVDECHHTTGSSPYAQIFNDYYHQLKKAFPQDCPRIIALSASIVPNKSDDTSKFLKGKKELEKILDSTVITTENLGNLLKYVANPDIEITTFAQGVENCELSTGLDLCIERMQNHLRTHLREHVTEDIAQYGNMNKDCNKKFKKYKKQITSFYESIKNAWHILWKCA